MTIQDIADMVQQKVAACPLGFVLNEVRAGAVDFARESDCWTQAVSANSLAGEAAYALQSASGYPSRVLALWVNRRRLYRAQYSASFQDSTATITLDSDQTPGSDEEGGICSVLSCIPASTDAFMADADSAIPAALERHQQALADRALFRLHAMRGKPWSSASDAQLDQLEYLGAVTRAKNETLRDVQRRLLPPTDAQHTQVDLRAVVVPDGMRIRVTEDGQIVVEQRA